MGVDQGVGLYGLVFHGKGLGLNEARVLGFDFLSQVRGVCFHVHQVIGVVETEAQEFALLVQANYVHVSKVGIGQDLAFRLHFQQSVHQVPIALESLPVVQFEEGTHCDVRSPVDRKAIIVVENLDVVGEDPALLEFGEALGVGQQLMVYLKKGLDFLLGIIDERVLLHKEVLAGQPKDVHFDFHHTSPRPVFPGIFPEERLLLLAILSEVGCKGV